MVFGLAENTEAFLSHQTKRTVMKNTIYIILILFSSGTLLAQHTISGRVTDTKNNPIEGANIYLEGTYDGASSDAQGKFTFENRRRRNANLGGFHVILRNAL